MATPQQIEANRQNAQQSTGPRPTAGKSASRFNALAGIDAQSEVIPGEDPGNLEALIAEYRDRWATHTPERRMLVDTLVNSEWMLRRMRRGEAQFWRFKDERTFTKTAYPEGRILEYGDKVYDRLRGCRSTPRDPRPAAGTAASNQPSQTSPAPIESTTCPSNWVRSAIFRNRPPSPVP